MGEFFFKLLNPALIWVLIPITWLLLTTVVEMLKIVQRHRERMALINQGIHPDLVNDQESANHLEELDNTHAAVDHVSARETAAYEGAR